MILIVICSWVSNSSFSRNYQRIAAWLCISRAMEEMAHFLQWWVGMIHDKFKGLLWFTGEQLFGRDASMCHDAAEVLGVSQFASFSQNPRDLERVIGCRKNIQLPGGTRDPVFRLTFSLCELPCHCKRDSFAGCAMVIASLDEELVSLPHRSSLSQVTCSSPEFLGNGHFGETWPRLYPQKSSDNPWLKSCALPPNLFHSSWQYSLQYFDGQVYDKSTRSSNWYQKIWKIQECSVGTKRLGFKHVKFPSSHSVAISDFISLLSFSKLFIKTFTRSALTAEVGRVCQASFLCAKITTEQHADSLGCDLIFMPATITRLKKEPCVCECCSKPFTKVGRNALTFQPDTQRGQLTHVNMSTLTHISTHLPVSRTSCSAPDIQHTSASTQPAPNISQHPALHTGWASNTEFSSLRSS